MRSNPTSDPAVSRSLLGRLPIPGSKNTAQKKSASAPDPKTSLRADAATEGARQFRKVPVRRRSASVCTA